MNLKEKLASTLGGAYYILVLISWALPIVMITSLFDLPFWTIFIMTAILLFIPSLSVIAWIVGLIGAIIGKQDIVAVIYYVAFVIRFLPTAIYIVAGFFSNE